MAFERRPKGTPPRAARQYEGAFVPERPRAVMATNLGERRALVVRPSLVPDLKPQHVAETTTDAERDYMGRVAALGCVVCRLMGYGFTAAQVHHIREGQGGAQRAGNYLTLPLCEPHHEGPQGIHGDKTCLRLLKMTELDLLDYTIGELQ